MATTITGKPFTEVQPSLTASRATGYIPPDATGTFSYSTATSTSRPHIPNPSTPAFINDFQWINSYLFIHKMTTPSYRYSFLMWLIIVLVVIITAILHWTGSRGGFLGAAWAKWALRRRTWRKKHTLAQAKREGKPHKQPFSFPSNAQMLSLVFLFVIPLALCVVGPDYIAPGTKLWDLAHNMTRRDIDDRYVQLDLHSRAVASTATTRSPEYTIPKAWWTAGGRTGIIAFALFPLVTLFSLKAPPFAIFANPFLIQIHFDKLARLHRWSGRLIWVITTVHVATWGVQLGRDKRGSGNRKYSDSPAWRFVWQYPLFIEGIIAYVALTALVVLSLDSFRVNHYEAFYVLHVILVPTTLIFAALHFPTIWWWCWSALFLWICERLHRAIRWAFVNGLMGKGKIPKGAEPPPMKYSTRPSILNKKGGSQSKGEDWEMGVRVVGRGAAANPNGGSNDPTLLPLQPRPPPLERDLSYDSAYEYPTIGVNTNETYSDWDKKANRESMFSLSAYQDSRGSRGSNSELMQYPPDVQSPTSARPLNDPNYPPEHNLSPTYPPSQHTRYSRIPPPGFAHAQLLPGRVIRLRLLTPRPIVWAPGQHVLLQVPGVSKFTTHPFTISGCYDNESGTGEGRVVELIVRAKNGFTKDLWDHVVQLTSNRPQGANYPFAFGNDSHVENGNGAGANEKQKSRGENAGVLLRAYVDGPFGSSIRAHWGNHSTVLIVVGGTGVSFGVAILEYLALCLAGRDGKSLGGRPGGWGHKGFMVNRVRFVWLIREFAHIQWAATVIRRCMELVPSSALQIDIFVSNTEIKHVNNRLSVLTDNESMLANRSPNELLPPSAQFMGRGRSGSNSSVDSAGMSPANSQVDVSYLNETGSQSNFGDVYHSNELGHEGHVLDYTNFDGEVDTRTPSEVKISKRLQKEGKLRRAKSRRQAAAAAAKQDLEARSKGGMPQPGPMSPPFDGHDRMAPPRPAPGAQRSGRASPGPGSMLPPGAYMPMGPQGSPPSTLNPQFGFSSADQYRSSDTALSPSDQYNPKRFSAGGLPPRATSPPGQGGHWQENSRLSVASFADISRAMTPSPTPGGGTESVRGLMQMSENEPHLEIDDQELEDVQVVSEMARPGKPKIDRILADEVGRSRGAVAVACCGPASLNALVRKSVAAQINPQQVLRGERQGMITLITEEFQW